MLSGVRQTHRPLDLDKLSLLVISEPLTQLRKEEGKSRLLTAGEPFISPFFYFRDHAYSPIPRRNPASRKRIPALRERFAVLKNDIRERGFPISEGE